MKRSVPKKRAYEYYGENYAFSQMSYLCAHPLARTFHPGGQAPLQKVIVILTMARALLCITSMLILSIGLGLSAFCASTFAFEMIQLVAFVACFTHSSAIC